MGCLARIGCFTLALLLGVLGLACLLATRPVGPRYVDGVYHYAVAGQPRSVRLSPEAARSFDAKVNGDLPRSSVIEAVTVGVPITEEELNSRVAEQLAAQPVGRYGATVERVFIRLAAGGARAYVYSDVHGVPITLTSDLVFRVSGGRVMVELHDAHAGRLPVGFLVPVLLSLTSDLTGIEQTIAVVIPPQVRAFRNEEGRLRVVLSPLPGLPVP